MIKQKLNPEIDKLESETKPVEPETKADETEINSSETEINNQEPVKKYNKDGTERKPRAKKNKAQGVISPEQTLMIESLKGDKDKIVLALFGMPYSLVKSLMLSKYSDKKQEVNQIWALTADDEASIKLWGGQIFDILIRKITFNVETIVLILSGVNLVAVIGNKVMLTRNLSQDKKEEIISNETEK